MVDIASIAQNKNMALLSLFLPLEPIEEASKIVQGQGSDEEQPCKEKGTLDPQ